jgi:quinol monooxygenase YgiN
VTLWDLEGSWGVMSYGYIASMTAKPGQRDAVVSILLSGLDGLRQAGCTSYVVTASDTDPETIWVFETWPTKAAHDESLTLPETREAIATAMPMLTGEFTSQEVTVVGGLGV